MEPKIIRQRLVIEGKYNIKISEEAVKEFLLGLAEELKMNLLTHTMIFSPNASKHPIHHGIAGFAPWVSSGSSLYAWDKFNFFTVEIFTCKTFSVKKAVDFTRNFMKAREIVWKEIEV